MLRRLGLNSVWSRLVASLALVVLPIALIVLVLAYSLYNAALADLQANETSAAAGGASMVRSWLDAAGRSLANESFAAGNVDAQRCALLADAFLRRNSGFAAVRFFDETGAPCTAGATMDFALLPREQGAAPSSQADYRLSVVRSQVWIVADYRRGPQGELNANILVVDSNALRMHLRSLTEIGNARIALIGLSGDVIADDPASNDPKWLPAAAPGGPRASWRSDDRTGRVAAYAAASIQGSTMLLLMRFDDHRLYQARLRLIVLCLAQLAMLGLLAFVYATTIRRDVVQWIQGIDVAARARGLDPESPAKAPVSPRMPDELRSVAESFNTMADHVIEHQRALKSSLAENRALMLEMHHRIKNSLQVIQSYLALIRRSAARSEGLPLARVEARVGVLAIAYRLALTPSGMRPIAVKPFLDEICSAAVAALRRPRQRVAIAIEWDGELVVDRVIPLGLGVVEALIVAFGARDAGYVAVQLAHNAEGLIGLSVRSDANANDAALPEKIMKGLASQLGATTGPLDAQEVAAWTFAP